MDTETLQGFSVAVIRGSGAKAKNLLQISAWQRELYEEVGEANIRLEQEQVGLDWVRQSLNFILKSRPEVM